MNYEGIAKELIEKSGGLQNIKAVGHCATRLRFTLIDSDKADLNAIKKVSGVVGAIYATGQMQIVLGKELIPIYEAAEKLYKEAGDVSPAPAAAAKKAKKTWKDRISDLIGFVAGAVSPIVPGLIAGGMLKVVLLLIGYAWPAFEETGTQTILSWVANAPFYFMPIFVAYGAAKQLGATPVYAMAGAASLLTPAFATMVSEGTSITMFGIPVRLVQYQQQLLPALLIAVAACYLEKLLNKIVPGIFKSIFVGMGTLGLSMILGFTILGPLGSYIGSAISGAFVWLGENVGPLAVALLSAALPWLIMTGMHHAISPFMAQSIADPGYDTIFRPSFILHNMAEGGACLGVGLRTKNPNFRSEVFGLAFGCIVAGVTEPAIYGVNLRLKRPMFGVMADGAVGGIVTGLLGAKAYAMGYSTVMALPIFQDTMVAMLIGIVVAIVVSAIVTFFLGFEEEASDAPEAEKTEAASNESAPKTAAPEISAAEKILYSPLEGKVIPLQDVKDELFAQGVMGDGVGIEPKEGVLYAPCDAYVEVVPDTGHAIGLHTAGGLDILLHIGINTVNMNGKGFHPLVKEGDHVARGDKLVEFSLQEIRSFGCPATTMVLVSNAEEFGTLKQLSGEDVKVGDPLYQFV